MKLYSLSKGQVYFLYVLALPAIIILHYFFTKWMKMGMEDSLMTSFLIGFGVVIFYHIGWHSHYKADKKE
ncbi:hypothetical protein COV05_04280 [Candidatus Uhrbacteria bacterium CG10_big_fil_rev_8_21_14_0_10_48_16]|uniref:Uncharacterized protein n=1 Tax=Candidatus Uhrbacteria bacterium CG10_big_fil_rev_8_21_14_0_10_48_16 TaxID=1975038 RepID=A0A2M8LGI3_9BACT|nr:MAG: hypothetical protein COV05_04280 [Candidatus Uhrbacteria bacterium CG10_big_fil_rev_8_21_14_0_10_48_16]